MLDVWPAFPIVIKQSFCSRLSPVEPDDALAILELHERVFKIDLFDIPSELLEQVGQVMQKPFPMLTDLFLIHSWADLPRVSAYSSSRTSHFRPYRIYSCLPLTFGILNFTVFLRISHPTRWRLACP